MAKIVGIIGEDKSDTDVLAIIIRKASPSRRYTFKTYHGAGKGKIIGKCNQWAKDLFHRGCTALVVIRDLDCESLDEVTLRLRKALEPSPIANYCIVVPVKMIEAWILSDTEAIMSALNLRDVPSSIPAPELISDPKSRLAELIYRWSEKRKRYLLTRDNARIAQCLNLEKLRNCASFGPLNSFITKSL